MVFLFVISHLSDEQYKLNAVRMYMVDYLENNCAFHVKRQRTTDREELNVIAAENTGKQEWEEKKGERDKKEKRQRKKKNKKRKEKKGRGGREKEEKRRRIKRKEKKKKKT